MTDKVYIYGLKDPRTGEIRYVGKSVHPRERYKQHVKGGESNLHKGRWIADLRRAGLKPEMIILEETTEAEWEARERHWIKQGLDSGWPLTNIAAGGACYPAPIVRHNWTEAIACVLEQREIDEFSELPEAQQFHIAWLAAMEIAEGLQGVARSIGREYNPSADYWRAVSVAQRSLDLCSAAI